MRMLDKSEMEMVSGAHGEHVVASVSAQGLREEPKFAVATGKDTGNHYGWCRGLGNTERSNGIGGGLDSPKHGDHVCAPELR